ncbi:uncharacterized protein LOC120424956 [Culex pipiens pallens]|uniref:uncharacterized protein LOC120424956 n=1 Tax=Culex pipiens pallens TaxID=42434 RepID=UPI0019537BFE|nr:uncharacterized protein LOC120424956 [Culex pipiens pallens]
MLLNFVPYLQVVLFRTDAVDSRRGCQKDWTTRGMNFSTSCFMPIVGNRHLVLLLHELSPGPSGVTRFSGSAYTDRSCGWDLTMQLICLAFAGAATPGNINRSPTISCMQAVAAVNGAEVVLVRTNAGIVFVECTSAWSGRL